MIDAERQRARIRASISVDENKCWRWQKFIYWNGYASFAFGGGANERAHRVAYKCFVGPIPEGMDVCHKCDVRDCVNPNHLFVGTRFDNLQDASKKGRLSRTHQKKGENHPSAKLADSDVLRALELIRNGMSIAETARQFCVSWRTIARIVNGTGWRHLTRTP